MKKSRTIAWVVVIAAVAAAGYFGWQRYHQAQEAAEAAAASKKSARNAVRVTIAPVQKSDFPVYLTGLGTVQGFNTVQVRT
ncbi:MAG: efflux RND transporter periplasmic adaptor subunit, partial [Terriglobia bacterium]